MRHKLVAGNWKMHGDLLSNTTLLEALRPGLAGLRDAEYCCCVPYPYLSQVAGLLSGTRVGLGAQDVSEFKSGAYTGEVAAAMLREFGCKYVIVGHSERRALFGETDDVVARKFVRALDGGLVPILCVGEMLAEREAGSTEDVVARQLDTVMDVAGAAALGSAVLAYEPVWAIGTGRTATPEQAQAVHAFLRQRVAARAQGVADALCILYGGSVKGSNAGELFSQADIDGGLVGGASLIAADFVAICQAANG